MIVNPDYLQSQLYVVYAFGLLVLLSDENMTETAKYLDKGINIY